MNEKNLTNVRLVYGFRLLWGMLLLAWCALATLSIWICSKTYDYVVDFILVNLGQIQHKTKFAQVYLTPKLFTAIQWGLPILSVLIGVGMWMLYRKQVAVLAWLQGVVKQLSILRNRFWQPLRSLTRIEKSLAFILLIFIFFSRLLLSINLPFHIDEMHSWLYFVDKGVLVSLSYYPSPNNHVFFSVLCCISDVFFADPLWVMRFTSIAIGMMVSFLVLRFSLSWLPFSWSLLVMVLFSFAPIVEHYSVLARGYMLETGLFILACWAFIRMIQRPQDKSYAWVYVASSALALFTLVTYVYAVIGFGWLGLLFFYKKGNIKKWILQNIQLAIATLVLYTPLLLFSGIQSIVGNGWIIRPTWAEYVQRIPDMIQFHAEYFTGVELLAIPLVGIIVFFILYTWFEKQFSLITKIAIGLVMTGIVITALQRIVPYERMWTHFIFLQQFLLVSSWYSISKKIKDQHKISAILIGAFFMFHAIWFMREKPKGPDIYDDAPLNSKAIIEQLPKNVFCQEYVYFNYLSVEVRKRSLPIAVENEGLSVKPDFVVQDRMLPWPAHLQIRDYQLWKTCDTFVCIYKRKD